MKIILIALLACLAATTTVTLSGLNLIPLTPEQKDLLNQAELAVLNQQRALHGTPAVTLNSTLINAAQTYADLLCSTGTFAHSPEANSGKYGENLFAASGTPSISYSDGKATLSWYKEISNYDFTTASAIDSTKAIGHFTAEIWKSVTTAGFGYGVCSSLSSTGKYWAKIIVVANFYPTPNSYYVGHKVEAYTANVPPLV